MISLKSLLLLFTTTALAATTPITVHSPGNTLILSDLIALDTSIKILTAAITNYTSGAIAATPILAGVAGVHLANRKAYADAMIIGNQSVADSETIVNYVSDPIAVDIPNSVKALDMKKPELVEARLRDQVVSSLELLLSDHETLSQAVAEKLAPETLVQALVPVGVIDAAIRSGIAYFEA